MRAENEHVWALYLSKGAFSDSYAFASYDPQADSGAGQDKSRKVDKCYPIKNGLTLRGLIVGCLAFLLGLLGTLGITKWRGWW
jgi:hypothetical protein